jgi:MerR family transcriptional regulator, light-induced transcriptional regulator
MYPYEPQGEAVRDIYLHRESLSERSLSKYQELPLETSNACGKGGRKIDTGDFEKGFSYLSEALTVGAPMLFVEYARWAKVVFAGLGFREGVAEATLGCMQSALQGQLQESLRKSVADYMELALENLRDAPSVLPSNIENDAPLAELARQYLEALLSGERRRASKLVVNSTTNGVSVKDLYLHVFQPVMYEIGRLWQMNQISIAQEHYYAAATQLIMSQLYHLVFSPERAGRRLVATNVSGELHELGIRMVTDFFEMSGWDTYYMGANTESEEVINNLSKYESDVLAISATMPLHVSRVRDLIRLVRSNEKCGEIKIIVGGYTFNLVPDLWQQMGSDGYALDAEEAVEVAHRLVAGDLA